jgi:NAD(P)H-flavin reductase
MQSFTADVARIRDLTHDVREIELRLVDPPHIAFQAGQFVSFQVPKAGLPFPVTRPYSIASPPNRSASIDILFNLVPDGPGSTRLYALAEGERVQFTGTAGTFVLREYADRDLLFVATGTGIAPIRSMILTRLSGGSPRSVTLFWGLRSERDLYYQDELQALADAHPNFSFRTILSQPQAEWAGPVGHVQRLVEEQIPSAAGLAAYICGNSAMIGDVTDILRRKGTCPIHREQYYRDKS